MKTLKQFLANPQVRLALRALVAAASTVVVQLSSSSSSGTAIAWHAVVVGAILAFCEVFTPLNQLVGIFKLLDPPAAKEVRADSALSGTATHSGDGGSANARATFALTATNTESSRQPDDPDEAPPAPRRAPRTGDPAPKKRTAAKKKPAAKRKPAAKKK